MDLSEFETLAATDIRDVRRCHACENLGQQHAAAVGYAKARVMVVIDHPSTREEIESGAICSSEWGDYLTFICDQAEMDREEFYFTALAKCRPHGAGEVTDENVATCMGRFLGKELLIVQPEVVVCCGRRVWETMVPEAVEAATDGKSSYVHGAHFRKGGRAFIACWHPKIFIKNNNIAPFVQIGDLIHQFLGA